MPRHAVLCIGLLLCQPVYMPTLTHDEQTAFGESAMVNEADGRNDDHQQETKELDDVAAGPSQPIINDDMLLIKADAVHHGTSHRK